LFYKEVGVKYGITYKVVEKVKMIVNEIDNYIKDNLDSIIEIFNKLKYKSFEESNQLC
jgi:hypothetical protein